MLVQDEVAIVHKITDTLKDLPLDVQRSGMGKWVILYHPCEPKVRDLPVDSPSYIATIYLTTTSVILMNHGKCLCSTRSDLRNLTDRLRKLVENKYR